MHKTNQDSSDSHGMEKAIPDNTQNSEAIKENIYNLGYITFTD